METVLVGLDIPLTSAESLHWAADYCRLNGDELVGVLAYRPSQSELPPDWYEEDLADVRKQAEAALAPSRPPSPTGWRSAMATPGPSSPSWPATSAPRWSSWGHVAAAGSGAWGWAASPTISHITS